MLLEQNDPVWQQDTAPVNLTPLDPGTVRLLSILECLYAEHAQGRPQVPLAALCKRLDIRMSTLQRLMTALSEQQLVTITMHKERLVAVLTADGAAIAHALQAAA